MGSKKFYFAAVLGLLLSGCDNYSNDQARYTECSNLAKDLNLESSFGENTCNLTLSDNTLSPRYFSTWYIKYSDLHGARRGLEIARAIQLESKVQTCLKKFSKNASFEQRLKCKGIIK